MKAIKKIALATAVSASLLGASGVMAAEQGTPGSSSKGNFDIFLTKDIQVNVWGFRDLYFTEDNGAIPAGSETVPLCITNSESDSSKVRFMVESGSTDFSLKNGGKTGGAYSVTIKDSNSSSKGEWGSNGLSTGIFSETPFRANTAGAPVGATLCDTASSNHTVDLTVDVTPDENADAGVYSDTVTVTVFPI